MDVRMRVRLYIHVCMRAGMCVYKRTRIRTSIYGNSINSATIIIKFLYNSEICLCVCVSVCLSPYLNVCFGKQKQNAQNIYKDMPILYGYIFVLLVMILAMSLDHQDHLIRDAI